MLIVNDLLKFRIINYAIPVRLTLALQRIIAMEVLLVVVVINILLLTLQNYTFFKLTDIVKHSTILLILEGSRMCIITITLGGHQGTIHSVAVSKVV